MNSDRRELLWITAAAVLLGSAVMTATAKEDSVGPGPAVSGPQASAPGGAPAPIVDPMTPIEQLPILLMPLTQEDLATEAKAWMAVAKEKTQAVVDARLRLKGGDTAAAGAADQGVLKAVAERSAAFERFSVVLAAWEDKGGDPKIIEEYRQYMTSVIRYGIKTMSGSRALVYFTKWLTAPEGGIQFAIRIGLLVVAGLIILALAKLASAAVARAVGRIPDVSILMKAFLTRAASWLIFVIGIMIALSLLGVNMGPLLALIGGGSFILAFALQNTLGNFAAGLMMMINKPFDVGHFVTLAGVSGTVKEVRLVSTTLLTPDNQVIVIPNNSVSSSIITNFSASGTRRVDLTFGIAYDADADAACRILEEIVAAHPLVLKDPAPVVRMHQLADSSVNFVCRPWTRTDDYWTVYWDITQQVKARFDAAGIGIPFPQRDVHVYTHTATS